MPEKISSSRDSNPGPPGLTHQCHTTGSDSLNGKKSKNNFEFRALDPDDMKSDAKLGLGSGTGFGFQAL